MSFFFVFVFFVEQLKKELIAKGIKLILHEKEEEEEDDESDEEIPSGIIIKDASNKSSFNFDDDTAK